MYVAVRCTHRRALLMHGASSFCWNTETVLPTVHSGALSMKILSRASVCASLTSTHTAEPRAGADGHKVTSRRCRSRNQPRQRGNRSELACSRGTRGCRTWHKSICTRGTPLGALAAQAQCSDLSGGFLYWYCSPYNCRRATPLRVHGCVPRRGQSVGAVAGATLAGAR